MRAQDGRRGIFLMALATLVFALQDGLSRHLADAANVLVVVTIRYWFFAPFALLLARARSGSLRAALRTRHPLAQGARGLLLAFEICAMVLAFTLLGLVESHAVFTVSPLLVAALSVPLLGERVGWRRWLAIGLGFAGVLVILSPGSGALRAEALVPLVAATAWALYNVLTRLVARDDGAMASFAWTGLVGALAMTPLGLLAWEPMAARDWALMGLLCLTSVLGHWLLIRAYELAAASAVQPFAYLQLVFASAVGVAAFGEALAPQVALGAAIVVGAGLFALWRERLRARRAPPPTEAPT